MGIAPAAFLDASTLAIAGSGDYDVIIIGAGFWGSAQFWDHYGKYSVNPYHGGRYFCSTARKFLHSG